MASTSVAERLGLDKGQHDLKLGRSFDRSAKESFHSIRYDFKPASVDTNQESQVLIGSEGGVEVTVPHIQGAGTSQTVYKGNKRPLPKECVLIINHDTGEISLERLCYAVQLKKTRTEAASRPPLLNQRPLTPIEKISSSPSLGIGRKGAANKAPSSCNDANHKPSPSHIFSPADIFSAAEELGTATDDVELSSSTSGSSNSYSSDSDEEEIQPTPQQPNNSSGLLLQNRVPPSYLHTLSQDLRLSESSDDDSD